MCVCVCVCVCQSEVPILYTFLSVPDKSVRLETDDKSSSSKIIHNNHIYTLYKTLYDIVAYTTSIILWSTEV